MSTQRDQGFAALKAGDIGTAVSLLEQATQNDPSDYQAHTYLGAAYGQSGQHLDAVRVLTHAVTLQPANSQARYNLAIAYERAGYTEQAITALEQALTLQPDYAKAQTALQRLRPSPAASSAYAVPPAEASQQPYAAAPAQQSYIAPQQSYAAPQPNDAQPTMQGYQPGQSEQPAGAPYGAPTYGAAQPMAYPQYSYTPDKFDLVQAFKDWGRVIVSPGKFFQDQRGREGLNAPISFYILVGLITTPISTIATAGMNTGGPQIPLPVSMVLNLVFGIGIGLVASMAMAGLFHLVSRLFGGQHGYSASFRAFIYGTGPANLLSIFLFLLVPVVLTPVLKEAQSQTNRRAAVRNTPGVTLETTPDRSDDGAFTSRSAPNASSSRNLTPEQTQQLARLGGSFLLLGILGLGMFIWTFVVWCIGFAHTQQLTSGGAFGTVLLSILIPFVLLFGLIFFLIMGMVAAASR